MDRTYNCKSIAYQHKFNNKNIIDGLFQDQPKYYVNMFRIPIVTNHAFIIESGKHGWKFGTSFIGWIYKVQKFWKFNSNGIGTRLSQFVVMPHLPTRGTNGKLPLMDYFQSHLMISKEYLKVKGKQSMQKK
jgi:hypothetical protein